MTSTRPLQGQKAIVTGANSGIGRAVAIALGGAGADVVVNHRDGEDAAMDVVRTIAQAGSRALAHRARSARPSSRSAWSTPEAYAALLRLVPYKRIGEPEDIGRAAIFLASDESDYITGTSMYVDGGMTLYPEFASGG